MSRSGLVVDRGDESSRLCLGARVTVYWPDDDTWYKGTVASEIVWNEEEEEDHDNNGSSPHVLVEYDDGDTDWMDISSTQWRSTTRPEVQFLKYDNGVFAQKKEKISKLKIGSRLSIWWPKEKEFYTGTLSEINSDAIEESSKRNSKAAPYRISYDDGDQEWVNLLHRRFRRVKAKADRLRVGSRVSVYHQDKNQHYRATVTKIKLERPRPHRVKYDTVDEEDVGGSRKEWLNLNVHPYLDIDRPSDPRAVNANTLKKRKREFLNPEAVVADDRKQQQKRTKKDEAKEQQPLAPVHETCVNCRSITKHARAATCHHIFCKRCIRYNSNEDDVDVQCPLCHVVIPLDQVVKYDKDHVSFRGVEALERSTAEVVKTYSSASAASLESASTTDATLIPFRIIEACQSKQRDEREYQNVYWRFQGSTDRILRAGEGIKEGFAVEQVDIETGKVIETFPSYRKASEKTGVDRCSIKQVVERKRRKANAGGFFWRFQGDTHGPWPDPEPIHIDPVEQLDFETGDLLKSYVSIKEAKKAMGMKSNAGCIRDVCNGNGRATAKGFFWRWKGSKRLPNHMMGVQKIIQIRKTKSGNVIKEFRTLRDAQSYFGHQCCWSMLCRLCREKGFYNGFYWQYRMLRERQSHDEEVVGKRLRVRQQGDEWLEGKIVAFNSKLGEHEIQFDSGTVERFRLSELQYQWKNDHGQKPVEQLDLKTGQVLATHDSVTDAAASIGNPRAASCIISVCMGKSISSGGFFWRYKGSDALPTRTPKNRRKVEQLCLKTGRVVATFDSIAAAGRANGITTPGISYCCNGRNNSKSAAGFGWRFSKADE